MFYQCLEEFLQIFSKTKPNLEITPNIFQIKIKDLEDLSWVWTF